MANLPFFHIDELEALNFSSGMGGVQVHQVLAVLPMAITLYQVDGTLIYLNPAAQALVPYPLHLPVPLAHLSETLQIFLAHTQTRYPTHRLPVVPALQGQVACLADLEIRWGDYPRIFQAQAAPIKNANGDITHAVMVLQEMTTPVPSDGAMAHSQAGLQPQLPQPALTGAQAWHRQQALENELRKYQTQLRSLAQGTPGVIYSLVIRANGEMRFEYLNCRIEQLFQAPLARITQSPEHYLLEQMHEADRAGFLTAITLSGEALQRFFYEWRHLGPTGQMCWLQTYAQPEPRENGDICWHGWLTDISDRKLTEQALQESEAQNRAIISALPDLMFRVSRDGIWLDYVRTNALIDCLPPTYNPQGRHLSEHMPAAIAQQQMYSIAQALKTGELQVFEQALEVNGRMQYEAVRVVPSGPDEVLFIVQDITARKQTELALQRSEAEIRAIITAIPDLMFRLHRDGTYLSYFQSQPTHDLVHVEHNPVGHRIDKYATTAFLETHIRTQMQAVYQALETGTMQIYEQTFTLNEIPRYEEVRVVPSGPDEVLVIIQDIGDRKAAELALQQSEAQNRAILKAIPDLMFRIHRDGTFLAYLESEAFPDLLAANRQKVGQNLKDFATTETLQIHIDQKMLAVHQALDSGEMQMYEQEIDFEGILHHEEVRVVPSGHDEVLVIIRDISDRKRMEAELRHANERLEKLSLTDALTTLANRRSLDEHLQREWRRAMRDHLPISFILFDLDYFKRYNDTYGHQRGDKCLTQVAQAALGAVNRASDLIARYGGEEFAVVLANTDLKGAYTIAERIRQAILALQIPHQTSEVCSMVTVSLGVSAIVPPTNSRPNRLIRQADQALYSAKQAGRNNCQCYISRDHEGADR